MFTKIHIGSKVVFKIAFLVSLIIGFLVSALQAGEISLKVDSHTASFEEYPISSGVPFPKGALFSLDNLRLEDSMGKEIPSQYHSLVKWPDGSHKVVLITLLGNISDSVPTNYTLHYGEKVVRSVYSTPLVIIQDSSQITTKTGPLKFTISKTSFNLFDQVWFDENGNGTFEESEKIINQPGNIFLINAFDSKEYNSHFNIKDYTVTIEEQGPIRGCIKATGKLQSQEGETLTDFKVWIYVYAGKGYVQVDYTLVSCYQQFFTFGNFSHDTFN